MRKSDRFYTGTGRKVLRAPFPTIVLAYTEFCKAVVKQDIKLARTLPTIREFAEEKFPAMLKAAANGEGGTI